MKMINREDITLDDITYECIVWRCDKCNCEVVVNIDGLPMITDSKPRKIVEPNYCPECGEAISIENNWKQRVVVEYTQVYERYKKLLSMIVKAKAGLLAFEPNCPISLLEKQLKAMEEYIAWLRIRAEIEDIDLGDK